MDKAFRFLASLKLAVALLVVLVCSLAIGTIVESWAGSEIAGRMVYYSWWFLALQALFVVNVAMSMVSFFPWVKTRAGYVITHASLVIIMLGAALTYQLKIEGRLFLWEGETGSSIVQYDSGGRSVVSTHDLPFTITLTDIVLDTYPGTHKPSGFASYVEVRDNEQSFQAKIWMNNELRYRGYSLLQSSYKQEEGREATELYVSKDPGKPIVFTGFITLLIGLVWMLVERVRISKGTTIILLLVVSSALSAQPAPPTSEVPPLSIQQMPVSVYRLARLPVQHDGRVMPFDTFAREVVKAITGSARWQGEEPVATVLQWINNPEGAAHSNIIKIGSTDLALLMGFPTSTKYASFVQLRQNHGLLQQLGMYDQLRSLGMPLTKTTKKALELEKRLYLMHGVAFGHSIRPIPVADDPRATWQAPEVISTHTLAALLAGPRLQGWPGEKKINSEVFYNNLNPVRYSWIIMLGALLFSILAWVKKQRWMDIAAFPLLSGSFIMMTWGIALRWQAGERIPAANMYESMLFLSWGVGLFALLTTFAFGLFRNRMLVLNATVMATLAMALTDLLPLDHFIHPIAPVLAGTPWLAIHVPIIMIGYAVLALGMLAAHMQVGVWIFCPNRRDLADHFYDILYWYNLVGSILLLAGILTGAMWGAISWGRYWGWDPKEVWSLVAFLAYMAIIHAKVGGLIDKFGVATFSILAFQTILMTYLGVNFVLSIGMHSYGMGDSPIARWLVLVALAEIAFVGVGVGAYTKLRLTR